MKGETNIVKMHGMRIILALVIVLTLVIGSVSTASAAPVNGKISVTAEIISAIPYGDDYIVTYSWSFTGWETVYIELFPDTGGYSTYQYSPGEDSWTFPASQGTNYTLIVTPLIMTKNRIVVLDKLAAVDTYSVPD